MSLELDPDRLEMGPIYVWLEVKDKFLDDVFVALKQDPSGYAPVYMFWSDTRGNGEGAWAVKVRVG